MFNIVLHEPEIPQNTGNIARTCSVAGCALHIIKPMGFEIDDKKLKRAGLDYWHELNITYYENTEEFFEKHKNDTIYFFTTKAPKCYTEITFKDGDYMMFGKETAGIPEHILKSKLENCVRIPMRENLRSLNLSNSVAVAVYEALRQNDFTMLRQTSEYLGD